LKILIIDNTIAPNKPDANYIIEAVKDSCDCKVIRYHEVGIGFNLDNTIDGLILTGSEARIVKDEDVKKFENVTNLVKKVQVPCLGICFGHQLLALAHGLKVGDLGQSYDHFRFVRIIESDDLFKGVKDDKMLLLESHNDYVMKEGLSKAKFRLLADSEFCEVEAIKHETKPIYGVQFHPEQIEIAGEVHKEGLKVIQNFINIIKSYSY